MQRSSGCLCVCTAPDTGGLKCLCSNHSSATCICAEVHGANNKAALYVYLFTKKTGSPCFHSHSCHRVPGAQSLPPFSAYRFALTFLAAALLLAGTSFPKRSPVCSGGVGSPVTLQLISVAELGWDLRGSAPSQPLPQIRLKQSASLSFGISSSLLSMNMKGGKASTDFIFSHSVLICRTQEK